MILLSLSSPRRALRLSATATAALLVLATPAVLRAQGSSPAPSTALARVSGKEYVLAHPSSFNPPPANARNPFWPIGWVPTAAPVAKAAEVLTVRPEDFAVTTISMDFPALAVINGKTRAVGDHIPVGADGQDFVTVKQILDGTVVLDYRGRELRASNGGAPRKAPGK